MSGHPLAIVGIVLILLGLVPYLATVLWAMVRVRRQYSRAMRGTFGFTISAGIAAANGRWWLVLPIIAGIVLFAVGRA